MNSSTRAELEVLITGLLEQAIDEAQHQRLEQLLREDWDCRRYYLEAMDQHARMLNMPALALGKLAVPVPPKARTWRVSRWAYATAAALVLGATGIGFFAGGQRAHSVSESMEQTENGCAMLVQAVNARFDGEAAPIAGAMLKPGALHLKRGLVRIEFFSGATVLLEGDADLEIVSAWEAACHKGKARVRVPPPAQGFRLQAPGMKLVDLGTEFGVEVDAKGGSQVHVFEGAVEAHPADGQMQLLKHGQNLQSAGGKALAQNDQTVTPTFTSIEQFDQLSADHAQARYDAWWQWYQEMRSDPRLIACYAFKHWKNDCWDRLVNNFTEPQNASRAGAAVGAHWTQGRWLVKDALAFKGPGDRVRINLGSETYNAITLACWVRVDGLDRKYNALLLTDGYEPGEPHWQIYEDGRLMFSVAYPDPQKPESAKNKRNQIYYTPSIFNLANQRRWHHIAVTYDNQSGEAVQYLDGRELSCEVSAFHQPGRPINFGPSEIGNWGIPTEGHKFPIRNLNGCIDEFAIYKAALPPAEIRGLYEAGKPD